MSGENDIPRDGATDRRSPAPWAPSESGLPELGRHQRLSPSEHARVGALLRARYEQGRTIRDLADATGYSLGRVRRLLLDAGTELRPRGGSRPGSTAS